jgi:PAS domain S-box-containing protein
MVSAPRCEYVRYRWRSMAGEGLFRSRKWVIVALRFLVLISLLVILFFQSSEITSLPIWVITVMLIILGGSNVWLIAMPKERFRSQMLYGWVFLSDLVVVALLMIAVAGNKIEFYALFIPYVATIAYTALTRRLSSAFLVVLIAAIVYGVLVFMSGAHTQLLSTPFLTWIVLFFLMAFFVGYLTEEIQREQEMTRKLEHTRKTAEEAQSELGELRSMHGLVIEAIPVGILVFNRDRAAEYANTAFSRMMGIARSDVVGRKATDIPCVGGDQRAVLDELLQDAVRENATVGPREFTCVNSAGTALRILCNIYPMARGSGDLALMAVLEDVTGEREAEKQRMEKTRVASQLRILSSLSGALSTLGSFRDIITRFASAAEPVLAFTACATLDMKKTPPVADVHLTTTVGNGFVQQLRERMLLSVSQLVPDSDKAGQLTVEVDMEKVVSDKDSDMRSFLAVPIVVENDTSAVIGFASEQEDAFKPQNISFVYTLAHYYSLILSKAKIEEEMLRREVDDQLHRERLRLEAIRREAEIEATRKRLEDEQKAVRELKRLDELKSEFISTVSHEMRTPMTSIKSSMDLLLSGRLGEIRKEHKPFLEIAVRNINRLAMLIDDVLNVSRIESGRLKMAPGVYEIKPIVANVIKTMETRLCEASDGVEDTTPADLEAYFDRNSLTQVFTNLVANAVNHNEPGIGIRIGVVSQEDGFVTISVADTGAGIPKGEREKIFERFYQAGRTYGEGSKGTGLGLTISRGLMRAMGGDLWLHYEDTEAGEGTGDEQPGPKRGRGADFRLKLPLTKEAVPGHEGQAAEDSRSDLDSEVLFGKIAVLMRFATSEQIDECAREQRESKTGGKMGTRLVQKGYLTAAQKEIILNIQQKNFSQPSPHDPSKALADTILGGLAVTSGALTESQLNECLREQALLESEGKPMLLGELLVRKGYMTTAEILKLISAQRGTEMAPPDPADAAGQTCKGEEA